MGHGEGQRRGFLLIHPAQIDRHRPRRRLIIGDFAMRESINEKTYLLGRENFSISFLFNYVDSSHRNPSLQYSVFSIPYSVIRVEGSVLGHCPLLNTEHRTLNTINMHLSPARLSESCEA
jgi:hypothetical protein